MVFIDSTYKKIPHKKRIYKQKRTFIDFNSGLKHFFIPLYRVNNFENQHESEKK